MIKCPINNCKNNHDLECTLKDLTLNVDMRCVCFEFKNRKCKGCGSEFKIRNERALYCSTKCRNLHNVRVFRGKIETVNSNLMTNEMKPENIKASIEKVEKQQEHQEHKPKQQEFKTFFKK